jgi:hypothetical protein
VDIGKPIRFYLYPGRSGLIDFPCSIISATPGPGKDVELKVGATNAKEVHIFLRTGASEPTNMIVRCQEAVFVFDIIPSTQSHQDYLQIVGYYGSPNMQGVTEVKNIKNETKKSSETLNAKSSLNKSSDESTKTTPVKNVSSISNPKDLDQIAQVLNKHLRRK